MGLFRALAAAMVVNVLYLMAKDPFVLYGKVRYPIVDVPEAFSPVQPRDSLYVNSDNERLPASGRILEGIVNGPETVIFDSSGNMYTLEQTGDIYWSNSDGGNRSLYAHTGGRPLGGKFDSDGNLIFADLAKGLCMVEARSRRVVMLTDRVSSDSPIDPGTPIQYADDVDIASDGTVYFSDACMIAPVRFANGEYDAFPASKMSFWQGPTGRLMSYNPVTGSTTVLATGIYFANGVALSSDESFVVVASTMSSRVFRFWLKGTKAGTLEPLTDLPGSPDGVSTAPDGSFWVALYTPTLDAAVLSAPIKLLRTLLSWMPAELQPKVKTEGAIAHLDKNGEIIRLYQDLEGITIRNPTSVLEHNKKLYIGSLVMPYVGVTNL